MNQTAAAAAVSDYQEHVDEDSIMERESKTSKAEHQIRLLMEEDIHDMGGNMYFAPPTPAEKSRHVKQTIYSIIFLGTIQALIFSSLITAVILYVKYHKATQNARLKNAAFIFGISGFRYDYLRNCDTYCPTLRKILDNGLSTTMLIPVFPATSLPNFWSMVTGVYPGKHGIIGDKMFDRATNKTFFMDSRDPMWWKSAEAEPIWLALNKINVSSAVFSWPGSYIVDIAPAFYDNSTIYDNQTAKIDQILTHLNNRSISLYGVAFFDLASEARTVGPDSQGILRAISNIDQTLAYFLTGLQAQGIDPFNDVNIIIVSDHGFSSINRHCSSHISEILSFAELSDFFNPNMCGYLDLVAFSGTPPENIQKTYLKLKQYEHVFSYTALNLTELQSQNLWKDASINFPNRTPDIVIQMKPNCTMSSTTENLGESGYDKSDSGMYGIFIASGPKFAKTRKPMSPFNVVDIYPLIASVIGLNESYWSPNIDGSLDNVKMILASTYDPN